MPGENEPFTSFALFPSPCFDVAPKGRANNRRAARSGSSAPERLPARSQLVDGPQRLFVDGNRNGFHIGLHIVLYIGRLAVSKGWVTPDERCEFAGFELLLLQDVYVIPSRNLVIVRMGHFVGMRPGTADLRRAEALLMEAIPERKR